MEESLKKVIWQRLGEAVLLVLLVAGMVWLWGDVRRLRDEVGAARQTFIELPQKVQQQDVLAKELHDRQHDIDRIEAFVVERDQIAEVVNTLESVARTHQVNVRIADIEEEKLVDSQGNTLESSGPISDVRITLVAFGDPAQLTSFLHAVEYMPYLLSIPEWRINGTSVSLPQGTLSQVPSQEPPGSSTPSVAARIGQLDASILLSIRNEE